MVSLDRNRYARCILLTGLYSLIWKCRLGWTVEDVVLMVERHNHAGARTRGFEHDKKQNKALLKNEGLIQVLFDKVNRWDGDWAKTSQW